MTMIEHDEAVRLAEKHGARVGGSIVFTDVAQLAALIAEVRRDEREKCAKECEVVPHGGPFAFAMRAKLEEGR